MIRILIYVGSVLLLFVLSGFSKNPLNRTTIEAILTDSKRFSGSDVVVAGFLFFDTDGKPMLLAQRDRVWITYSPAVLVIDGGGLDGGSVNKRFDGTFVVVTGRLELWLHEEEPRGWLTRTLVAERIRGPEVGLDQFEGRTVSGMTLDEVERALDGAETRSIRDP